MTKRLGIRSIQTVNHIGWDCARPGSLVSARFKLWDINGLLRSRFASWLKSRSRRTESLTWVKWQYGILTERQTRVCTGLCATGTEWTPGAHLY